MTAKPDKRLSAVIVFLIFILTCLIRLIVNIKRQKKNVHAFVRGDITVFDDFDPDYNGYSLVSYNPYKHDTFVDVHDVTPVRKAKRAVLQLEPRWSSVFMRPYVYVEGASSC